MNIKVVPNTEQDKLMAAVERMRRTLPALIEFHQLDAKIKRAAFMAYKAEGFTDAEALQLTMDDPLKR